MRTISIIGCIVAFAIGGQSQSKASPQLSDAFAKAALHVAVALQYPVGKELTNIQHVTTLLEDVEIEESTTEETAIRVNLQDLVRAIVENNGENLFFFFPSYLVKAPTPIVKNIDCVNAYRISLKARSPLIPDKCKEFRHVE
jgi:hypothetical protein